MPDNLHRLPRIVYPLRILGMGLGGAVAMVVLHERQAPPLYWLLVALGGLVWPHLAWWLSRRSPHPQRAELRNLLVDSAIAGAFVPLMQFNLLPSVLLLTLALVDKISTGIRLLWLRSLPLMALGGLATWLALRPAPVVESSMLVVIACLPMLVLHTLSVSLSSYRLIRKVSHQNRLLDELRRIDPLTGLYARSHWEQQVAQALERRRLDGMPACLLMMDIDGFKQINDARGHTVGDDVIRAMGHIVQRCVRATDCAGRYGGDEFAVLLNGADMAQAREIAQRIRLEAEAWRWREDPELRFTSSIGIAAARRQHATPRDWVAAADQALYQAKRAGRNRVEVRHSTRHAALHG